MPSDFNFDTVLDDFQYEDDPLIIHLVGDCLNSHPSSRPNAAQVQQLFSDKHADACAKSVHSGISGISDLLEKGRNAIDARRRGQSTSISVLTREDVADLLAFENSWDDVESLDPDNESGSLLRLAPQVKFLLGAGILWEVIDVDHVRVRPTIVSRGTNSLKGIAPLWLLFHSKYLSLQEQSCDILPNGSNRDRI